MLHVATLEQNKVKKVVKANIHPTNQMGGSTLRPDMVFPNILAIPLTLLPSARAKPPPKRDNKHNKVLNQSFGKSLPYTTYSFAFNK